MSSARRALLASVVALWLLGTAAVFAVPLTRPTVILVMTEPALTPWANDVIRRDASLAAFDWRVVSPEQAGSEPSQTQVRLGLLSEADASNANAVVARSPYVVVAWE